MWTESTIEAPAVGLLDGKEPVASPRPNKNGENSTRPERIATNLTQAEQPQQSDADGNFPEAGQGLLVPGPADHFHSRGMEE